MLKNFQNKISFSYVILLTLKMSLKLEMKWRLVIILAINLISNGDKLLIQFPKLGKKYLNNHTLGIEKMNSKEIYSIIISSKVNVPTSRIYFENKFPLYNFQWKEVYTLPHKVTIDAYLRSFQYKIPNNMLYLNKNFIPLLYQTHNYVLFAKWKKRQ